MKEKELIKHARQEGIKLGKFVVKHAKNANLKNVHNFTKHFNKNDLVAVTIPYRTKD